MASIIQFTPMRLVTSAAIAPNYRMALLSLIALAGCAAIALLLLRWSFSRSLSDQETNRPRSNRAAGLIRFPGRLGGLVRKEQNYFRKRNCSAGSVPRPVGSGFSAIVEMRSLPVAVLIRCANPVGLSSYSNSNKSGSLVGGEPTGCNRKHSHAIENIHQALEGRHKKQRWMK